MERPSEYLVTTPVSSSGRVRDIAYNYSKQRMATCTAEGSVSIWHRPDRQEEWTLTSRWEPAAQQQITKVTWAPAEFGSLLVVGTDQGEVSIWRDEQVLWESRPVPPAKGTFGKVKREASMSGRSCVCALAFAPQEHGLHLAVVSTSGVRLFQPSPGGQGNWVLENNLDVPPTEACTSVAWQPYSPGLPPMLLVGSSAGAKVWMYSMELMQWHTSAELPVGAPVASVAWAVPAGRSKELVAVASQDIVAIFGLAGRVDSLLIEAVAKLEHGVSVINVGWNPLGSWLAASTKDSQVLLWRPNLAGQWQLVNRIVGTPESDMQQ